MKMDVKENSTIIEEIFFKTPKKCCRWMGVWPEDNLFERKNLGFVAFAFVTMIIHGLAHYAYIVDNYSDDSYDVFNVCFSMCVVWISIFKLFVVLCMRQRLKTIIIFLKKMWIHDPSRISVLVNFEMAKRINKVAFLLIVGGYVAVVAFVMEPIVLNIQRLSTGQSYTRILSFKSKYPFRTDTSPIYELTFIFVSSIGFIVVLAYNCADGIFITLCTYIGAQFKIIQQNLLDLNDANGKPIPFSNKYNKHECDKVLMQLSRIIQIHVDAIQLTKDVSELFKIIIQVQLLTAALNIGLAVTLLTKFRTPTEAILYFFLVLVFLAQQYVYCYGGSFIMKSSAEIAPAAYEFNWHLYDKRVAKTIALIILRAQHECCINVPFVQVSANTFLNIIRTAGSYITIMKTLM